MTEVVAKCHFENVTTSLHPSDQRVWPKAGSNQVPGFAAPAELSASLKSIEGRYDPLHHSVLHYLSDNGRKDPSAPLPLFEWT